MRLRVVSSNSGLCIWQKIMKLIDFKENEQFDRLRKSMGTEDYGHFELFDPKRHLTWQERQSLQSGWVDIISNGLHAYGDKTLAYKNTYVFAEHESTIHFALCDQLKKRMSQGRLSDVAVTLDAHLVKDKKPCEYCLHAVSYEGFDVYRHRHQEYNDRIIKKFDLFSYLKQKHNF